MHNLTLPNNASFSFSDWTLLRILSASIDQCICGIFVEVLWIAHL